MIVDLEDMKRHLNVTDDGDDLLIEQKIGAAQSHVEGMLGFAIEPFYAAPLVVPEALKEAVRLYAGHLFENREASIVGVSVADVPGFAAIIANHREWTF